MRGVLLLMSVIGAMGIGIAPAGAAPMALPPDAGASPVLEVRGPCGPHFHFVPQHVNRYGRFVPAHCVPNHHRRHRHWRR